MAFGSHAVVKYPLQLPRHNKTIVGSKESLLEKQFIVTPPIHFWYRLTTVANIKNKDLFFISADVTGRHTKIMGTRSAGGRKLG
jgi:hypothetical protein